MALGWAWESLGKAAGAESLCSAKGRVIARAPPTAEVSERMRELWGDTGAVSQAGAR